MWPSQIGCGYYCNNAGTKIIICVQASQKSYESSSRQSLINSGDRAFVSLTAFRDSGPPAWKRLLDCPPSIHERISMINFIFSDHDEVEAVGNLSADDAQTLINIVYEVTLHVLSPLTPAETSVPH